MARIETVHYQGRGYPCEISIMLESRLQYEIICAAVPLASLYFNLYFPPSISKPNTICSFSLEDVRHPSSLHQITTIVRICYQCTPQAGAYRRSEFAVCSIPAGHVPKLL